ncbi:BppU family phage baseplate upper protein [Clostridium felsineum]|uniref:BppU family phage baseplate upper protein n=1 Tax=Clostridium felsineum TaxID=36839 RepID=UPI002033615C|nr:BppU family phage baseplate upper protein [Clostridium felsineum]
MEFNKSITGLPDVKTSDHKSRGLDITVISNGVVQNTTGMILWCSGKTPNGRTVTQQAELEDASVGHYMLTFPDSMLNKVGEVSIELTLIDGAQTLSTNTGTINVIEAVTSFEDMEDDPNYPSLLKAMNIITDMKAQIAAMQTQIDSLEKFETGCIVMSPVALDSRFWLPMDGSITDLTNYPALKSIYPNGLPNISGKVPVQIDSSQAEFNTLNQTGGEKVHTLSTAEIPSHTHQSYIYTSQRETPAHYCLVVQGYGGNYGFTDRVMIYNNGLTPQDGYICSVGGGASHNNLQPYCVIGKFYVHI